MPHHEQQRRPPGRSVDFLLLPGALLPTPVDREHRGVLPSALDVHHGVVGLLGGRREEAAERGEDLGGADVGGLAEQGADKVDPVVVAERGDELRWRVREEAGLRESKEDVVPVEACRLGGHKGSDSGGKVRGDGADGGREGRRRGWECEGLGQSGDEVGEKEAEAREGGAGVEGGCEVGGGGGEGGIGGGERPGGGRDWGGKRGGCRRLRRRRRGTRGEHDRLGPLAGAGEGAGGGVGDGCEESHLAGAGERGTGRGGVRVYGGEEGRNGGSGRVGRSIWRGRRRVGLDWLT